MGLIDRLSEDGPRAAPDVETDLPDDAEPSPCPRCDRPFLTERQRDLHLGEVHDDLTDEQRRAHEAAVEAEDDEMYLFHMKVVVALGLLYSTTVIAYTALVGLAS